MARFEPAYESELDAVGGPPPVQPPRAAAPGRVTRRTALVGACACALLTACGGGGGDGGAAATGPSPAATTGPRTVPVSRIPVGGSLVVMVDVIYPVVVARPTSTEFAAHTAVCTHQGCTVKPGQGLELDCPCHGSRFDAADGRVLGGPATRPLQPWPFTVQGDLLTLHAHEASYDKGGSSGSANGM
ncbi:ubiquinol-cytochrome c reductase iron-sulfur subunit [Streptacidiphilus sp. P02-A3a]|uniref:QcrA and Rieske domain-containing protein n=1 Tax=Streptacidiphilus sp. P02-A3a TaxID=2704468 RepID=UPI0015F845E9|nr:Rieske (2Fe-2S) protein [Streptacidiphilus sp. P02-A3a]QMU69078.1 Rieske (2Fe-2S) protein [Streptacidiphilus sp. P02-A3a]